MMLKVILESPAKVNLFLRILGKRADGYHELASLFQAVTLFDTLYMELADQDSMTCSDPTLPTDGTNLVLKAAALFRRKTGSKQGLKVHLEKRIPHEAGLGGGSGDAATTLWGLNLLRGSVVSQQDLATWSAEIGSDVPFFFSEGTAYCTGKGEILQSQPPIVLPSLWIVKPTGGTSTPAVYKNLDLTHLTQRDPLIALESFYTHDPHYFNDLEAAALFVMPELALLKKQLLQVGYKTVLLAGSGSSLICIGENAPPSMQGCAVFHVKPLQRRLNEWYKNDPS